MDADALGDLFQGDAVQTVARKQFLRHVEDLLHRLGTLLGLAGATWRYGRGRRLSGHGSSCHYETHPVKRSHGNIKYSHACECLLTSSRAASIIPATTAVTAWESMVWGKSPTARNAQAQLCARTDARTDGRGSCSACSRSSTCSIFSTGSCWASWPSRSRIRCISPMGSSG